MKLKSMAATVAAQSARGLDKDRVEGMLDGCRDLDGERAVILGRDIAILCELIRRGCLEVTEVALNERPQPGAADIVVVTSVGTSEMAVSAVLNARRCLAPAGRILMQTDADPSGRLGRAIERILRLHGFSAVRRRRVGNRTIVAAELPLFGPAAFHAART